MKGSTFHFIQCPRGFFLQPAEPKLMSFMQVERFFSMKMKWQLCLFLTTDRIRHVCDLTTFHMQIVNLRSFILTRWWTPAQREEGCSVVLGLWINAQQMWKQDIQTNSKVCIIVTPPKSLSTVSYALYLMKYFPNQNSQWVGDNFKAINRF